MKVGVMTWIAGLLVKTYHNIDGLFQFLLKREKRDT